MWSEASYFGAAAGVGVLIGLAAGKSAVGSMSQTIAARPETVLPPLSAWHGNAFILALVSGLATAVGIYAIVHLWMASLPPPSDFGGIIVMRFVTACAMLILSPLVGISSGVTYLVVISKFLRRVAPRA